MRAATCLIVASLALGCSRQAPVTTGPITPSGAGDGWKPPAVIQPNIAVERRFARGNARQQ
jgi:hypothetical protein